MKYAQLLDMFNTSICVPFDSFANIEDHREALEYTNATEDFTSYVVVVVRII